MKQIYTLILFISFSGFAQTPYGLFNSKSELFFADIPNNYLKGIRPDSVKFNAGDSIYYHYRIYFNIMSGPACRKSNYPSWLGTRTIKKPNEDYIFFNKANDSIIIKTAASTGSSWIYYKYPSGDYIRATLASRQYTTTYNSLSDTVKSIIFQAYNSSNAPISHAYNTQVLKIARTQGVISMGNMFDFPTDVTFYNRSYGKHLTLGDVCDLGPGDIVQRYAAYSNYNMSSPVTYTNYYTDTIASRVYITSDSVHITDTKANLFKIGKLNSYMVSQMPEQAVINNIGPNMKQIRQVMYRIYGSFACQRTVISYVNDICGYLTSSPTDTCFSSASVSCTSWGDYKWYEKGWMGAAPLLDEYYMYPNYARTGRGISYSKINNVACGTFFVTNINEQSRKSSIKIYPNPADNFLVIDAENKEFSYKIYHMTGKLILQDEKPDSNQIELSSLKSGLYFVQIQSEGQTANFKIVKE